MLTIVVDLLAVHETSFTLTSRNWQVGPELDHLPAGQAFPSFVVYLPDCLTDEVAVAMLHVFAK